MAKMHTIEVPIQGMDCADCTHHVQQAIARVPGVKNVQVLLASEKAIIEMDGRHAKLSSIEKAVARAGYFVAEENDSKKHNEQAARRALSVLALVVGAVLFLTVAGEWLGLFQQITSRIPFWLGAIIVLAAGLPIFVDVIRSALNRQVTSRTLMTLGVIAALSIGQWITAGVVVFMMHIGNFVEGFTTDRSRKAIRDLTRMIPQTARIEKSGKEQVVPVEKVVAGDIVVLRPGETIPVDGRVVSGDATIDQSSITGEPMPVEAGEGAHVFASTVVSVGSIRIETIHAGRQTTFGKVIVLVEEAESRQGDFQQFADKFSGYYLPLVAGIALLTLILSRNPLQATAVLVVACSCSIALATPMAMLASIGAAAKRGLLIKGGKYLEILAKVDVVLIDKTGTLTLGKPKVERIVPMKGISANALLALAASAERFSEHPLAHALRKEARERALVLHPIKNFRTIPGVGVKASVGRDVIIVGNERLLKNKSAQERASLSKNKSGTVLYVERNGKLVGMISTSDTLRNEVPESLGVLRSMGIERFELLTGDNEVAARKLAEKLRIPFRAGLLPQDKIRIVKNYQEQGRRVVMIGDGVNDAPALAQADVGIAMGDSGSDIALESADMALLQEDWLLVPALFQIARRTMGVVRMNLVLTGIYNVVGIGLAALGILPPVLAAAMQSLPDLGILGNTARLLKQKTKLS
jgi:Cu+-exporting ATPase